MAYAMEQRDHETEGVRVGESKGQETGSEGSQEMGRKPQSTEDVGSMGTGNWTGTVDWRALWRKGQRAVSGEVGHSSSHVPLSGSACLAIVAEGSFYLQDVSLAHRTYFCNSW